MIEDQGSLFAELGEPSSTTKLANEPDDVCRCGHSADHHADFRGKCLYGMSSRIFDAETKTFRSGACDCKRFHNKKRAPVTDAPNFATPAGAIDWFRGPPEIVRRKRGGWLLGGKRQLTAFVALAKSTKLESSNVLNRGGFGISKLMLSRLIAGDANRRKAQKYRTEAALEQAHAHFGAVMGAAPATITITRVASRPLDDDNLIGACKAVRDGIAEALGVDDARFSIGGEQGKIPIFYKQAKAGARGAYAVLIEITW